MIHCHVERTIDGYMLSARDKDTLICLGRFVATIGEAFYWQTLYRLVWKPMTTSFLAETSLREEFPRSQGQGASLSVLTLPPADGAHLALGDLFVKEVEADIFRREEPRTASDCKVYREQVLLQGLPLIAALRAKTRATSNPQQNPGRETEPGASRSASPAARIHHGVLTTFCTDSGATNRAARGFGGSGHVGPAGVSARGESYRDTGDLTRLPVQMQACGVQSQKGPYATNSLPRRRRGAHQIMPVRAGTVTRHSLNEPVRRPLEISADGDSGLQPVAVYGPNSSTSQPVRVRLSLRSSTEGSKERFRANKLRYPVRLRGTGTNLPGTGDPRTGRANPA